ncbi:hypothetical protein SVAN01_01902 [Stagonosporopsis vannaccii]|nr:hypothetical protein SVAN01_01902 [Stagonosporopsis vannaccii]
MPGVEQPVSSASLQAPPLDQPTNKARKPTPPSDSESDEVTGYVLASGRYKCSDPECRDLRFGRQADFRRHFINAHADRVIEHFCPITGCERSRKPEKRSKGRSFKARKDKMEEHLQTVHYKSSKKRRVSSATLSVDDEDAEEAEQQQPKMRRRS